MNIFFLYSYVVCNIPPFVEFTEENANQIWKTFNVIFWITSRPSEPYNDFIWDHIDDLESSIKSIREIPWSQLPPGPWRKPHASIGMVYFDPDISKSIGRWAHRNLKCRWHPCVFITYNHDIVYHETIGKMPDDLLIYENGGTDPSESSSSTAEENKDPEKLYSPELFLNMLNRFIERVKESMEDPKTASKQAAKEFEDVFIHTQEELQEKCDASNSRTGICAVAEESPLVKSLYRKVETIIQMREAEEQKEKDKKRFAYMTNSDDG